MDGNYRDFIATPPGTDSSAGIVMVGAHYDSRSVDINDLTARAPGATDDGCGVAIVLELARIMSHHQFNHTIAFALWNSEEQDEEGSSRYVESAVANSTQISLYFNYDSACCAPTGNFTLDIMDKGQSSWAAEI